MKYKIEKNTVQETLIIPLYARKVCSELYPNLYRDETAVRLIDEIDYDFSEAEKNHSCNLHARFVGNSEPVSIILWAILISSHGFILLMKSLELRSGLISLPFTCLIIIFQDAVTVLQVQLLHVPRF